MTLHTFLDINEHLRCSGALYQILERGYAEIPWPDITTEANRVERGFSHLLDEETEENRNRFIFSPKMYRRDELNQELEIGLLEKRVGGTKSSPTDLERAEGRLCADRNKHRFHYGDNLSVYLKDHVALLERHRDLISGAAMLNSVGRIITQALALALDERNGVIIDPKKRYADTLYRRVLLSEALTRILRYEPSLHDAPHALAHRDRDFLTVHWHSSHPGLTLFDKHAHVIHAHETDPKRILIFPGIKFWGVLRGIYGTGLIHGVRAPERDAIEAMSARFAIVTFVHCMLPIDDVLWMRAHMGELVIDPARYRL